MNIAEITPTLISDLENYHSTRRTAISKLQGRYELNKTCIPIYQRKFEIDGEVQSDLVNNPVHVDFFGNIVNTKIGYLFGNPVDIKIEDETAQQFIDDFTKRVYFEDLLAEVGTYAAVGGFGALLLYNNIDGEADLMSVDPYSCLFIGADILNPDLAIRFYDMESIENSLIVKYRYAEVYDKSDFLVYRIKLNESQSNNANKPKDTNTKNYELYHEPIKHGFEDIPLIAFKNNDNLKGDCENVLDSMDAYDRVLTDELCDIEQYRMDYLVIIGDLGEKPDKAAQKLKKMRIMYLKASSDGENKQDAKFITRLMPLDQVNATLDRNKKEIYEISRHLNVSDDSIGNASSGVALRNRQLPFEFKCLETEREFKASLTKLFKLLSAFWSISRNVVNYLDIEYIFTRNYANNKLEESQIIKELVAAGLPLEIAVTVSALNIDVEEVKALLEEKANSEAEKLKQQMIDEEKRQAEMTNGATNKKTNLSDQNV